MGLQWERPTTENDLVGLQWKRLKRDQSNVAAIRKANSESNVFGLLRQKANTENTAERLQSRSAVFPVLAFCRNSPNTLLSELAFLIAATLD